MKRGAASALGLLTILVVAAAASAATLPGVVADGGTVTKGKNVLGRPRQIVYTGDGSGVLGGFTGKGPLPRFGRLLWPNWTDTQAQGSGAVWLDDCAPNCAEGSFHPYAAKVRALAPRSGHFTRLTLNYDHNGKRVIERLGISKFGANYGYYTLG